MASQRSDPPAPQSEVTADASANIAAHIDPYVDQDITKRNVTNSSVPTPYPANGTPAKLGGVRPLYTNDRTDEVDQTASNVGTNAPPYPPNRWITGRDPYANNGTDSYLRNGG